VIKRREFTQQLVAAPAALALAGAAPSAMAQAPVEGANFVRLQTPAPVQLAPGKKIDVVYFFWYECPACNAFGTPFETWEKRQPADVQVRYVPVGFTARHQVAQRLFYALEELDLQKSLHRRIFAAVHVQRRRMSTDDEVRAFVKDQGVDMAKFDAAIKSFQVNTKTTRARQLADAYKLDGVPTVGVHGRFFTSPALAGGYDKATAVMDFLIQRSRSA
jgi:protein dithiol oxidoreductase (disulfide-forming)